ncbi:MauE/DoxX family redox-associated membrane protein [Streptomyces triculaminicus]|uniref:MauE/DoxX family redox-associated membrane protein n=1 Tax=Streptomyces triculaminicus TaxID=2816232 RepID=UPI0033D73564
MSSPVLLHQLSDTARILLALVFLCSLAGKLRGTEAFLEFRAAIGQMAPSLLRVRKAVAVLVVPAEALTVVTLALPATAVIGLSLSAALLAVFTAGLAGVLRRGATTPCHCFGRGAPIAPRHVVRNVLLGLAALAGLGGRLVVAGTEAAAGGVNGAGLLLATGVAALLALVTVTLDDLAGLFAPRPAAGKNR